MMMTLNFLLLYSPTNKENLKDKNNWSLKENLISYSWEDIDILSLRFNSIPCTHERQAQT